MDQSGTLVCHECHGTQFTLDQGYYVCDMCGVQSQDLRHEVLELQDKVIGLGVRTSKKHNKVEAKQKTVKKSKNPVNLTFGEAFTYLHVVLNHLCKYMIANENANPLLLEVASSLYTQYLHAVAVVPLQKEVVPELDVSSMSDLTDVQSLDDLSSDLSDENEDPAFRRLRKRKSNPLKRRAKRKKKRPRAMPTVDLLFSQEQDQDLGVEDASSQTEDDDSDETPEDDISEQVTKLASKDYVTLRDVLVFVYLGMYLCGDYILPLELMQIILSYETPFFRIRQYLPQRAFQCPYFQKLLKWDLSLLHFRERARMIVKKLSLPLPRPDTASLTDRFFQQLFPLPEPIRELSKRLGALCLVPRHRPVDEFWLSENVFITLILIYRLDEFAYAPELHPPQFPPFAEVARDLVSAVYNLTTNTFFRNVFPHNASAVPLTQSTDTLLAELARVRKALFSGVFPHPRLQPLVKKILDLDDRALAAKGRKVSHYNPAYPSKGREEEALHEQDQTPHSHAFEPFPANPPPPPSPTAAPPSPSMTFESPDEYDMEETPLSKKKILAFKLPHPLPGDSEDEAVMHALNFTREEQKAYWAEFWLATGRDDRGAVRPKHRQHWPYLRCRNLTPTADDWAWVLATTPPQEFYRRFFSSWDIRNPEPYRLIEGCLSVFLLAVDKPRTLNHRFFTHFCREKRIDPTQLKLRPPYHETHEPTANVKQDVTQYYLREPHPPSHTAAVLAHRLRVIQKYEGCDSLNAGDETAGRLLELRKYQKDIDQYFERRAGCAKAWDCLPVQRNRAKGAMHSRRNELVKKAAAGKASRLFQERMGREATTLPSPPPTHNGASGEDNRRAQREEEGDSNGGAESQGGEEEEDNAVEGKTAQRKAEAVEMEEDEEEEEIELSEQGASGKEKAGETARRRPMAVKMAWVDWRAECQKRGLAPTRANIRILQSTYYYRRNGHWYLL